jgi:hypothetical protein
MCGFFGIFDGGPKRQNFRSVGSHATPSIAGHGGPNAADFVRSNLFENLLLNIKFPSDVRGAIGAMSWLSTTYSIEMPARTSHSK